MERKNRLKRVREREREVRGREDKKVGSAGRVEKDWRGKSR